MLSTLMRSRIEDEDAVAIIDALDDAFRSVYLRTLLFFVPEGVPLPGELKLRNAIKTINTVILGLIERRRHERAPGPLDLMSLFIDRQASPPAEALSDTQVRDHLVTFYLAGYETTAVALTWTWYLLAEHPACFDRLRAELAAVLHGRPPTVADLPKLRYMRMVIQESMRLYPPAWFFPRFARNDDDVDGYRIAAGSTVLMSPYVTHRLPTIWADPDSFDPERFSPERSAGRHRLAHVPFGVGPRQCIGLNFAMMQMQIVLATIAARLRPVRTPGPPAKPRPMLTLTPSHAVPVQFATI